MRERSADKQKYPLKEPALIIAIILPFLFWLLRYINIDFWYDEIFTLHNYAFTSLGKTVTDYSFPNNHIFFNLINNIYLKSIGASDVFDLMDMPFRIRLLPFAYTMGTLFYLYLIGKKFFNEFIANLSLIILVTTIPFYNFALQVRGYGLSIMLLCMMLYHLWSFEKSVGFFDGLLVVFSTAFCLYTIPSNLYFILGAALFYGSLEAKKWGLIFGAKKSGDAAKGSAGGNQEKSFFSENRYLTITCLLGTGIILAILMYLPVIDKVLHNRFVESHGLFYPPTLVEILPRVFCYFISERYLLVLMCILGWIMYIRNHKEKDPELIHKALCCSVLFLLPFLLSFIRGDRPFLRVFLNLVPLFALLISIGVHFLISSIPVLRSRRYLITVLMILYCNVAFGLSLNDIGKRIGSDIVAGRKSQDMYYNYYQAHYNPLKLARDFARGYEAGDESGIKPVLYEYDQVAMSFYLEKFGIGFFGPDALKSIMTSQRRVDVITAFPNEFEKLIAEEYPQFECKRVNERLQFHNTFVLTGIDEG